VILFASFEVSRACYIQGQDSGVCTDPINFDINLPFCSKYVKYRACLPAYNELFSSNEDCLPPNEAGVYEIDKAFETVDEGNDCGHTAIEKDFWIQGLYEAKIGYQLRRESDDKFYEQGDKWPPLMPKIDEWSLDPNYVREPETDVEIRFTDNLDCQRAWHAYFCYINFPRCDAEDKSLMMCRSACENLMVACNYGSDLSRCGEDKFFGGEEAEEGIQSHESVRQDKIYLRYPYPGAPFVDYKEGGDEKPIEVCTPSIKNAAHASPRGAGWAILVMSWAAALWILFV